MQERAQPTATTAVNRHPPHNLANCMRRVLDRDGKIRITVSKMYRKVTHASNRLRKTVIDQPENVHLGRESLTTSSTVSPMPGTTERESQSSTNRGEGERGLL